MRKQITVTDDTQAGWEAILGEAIGVGTLLTITAPKEQVGRACACGCGGKTGGGFWVPGHDAKRKSLLFAEYRSGDPARRAAAEAELVSRDWPVPNAKRDRAPVMAQAPIAPVVTDEEEAEETE